MAESQLKHRQTMESRVVQSNCTNERAGLVIGAILTGIAIIGGIYLAAHDKPLSGFGVIIVDLATLAGVFVYARQAQAKERAQKIQPFKQTHEQSPTPPVA